ncbi:MAG: DUF1937 family protein [Deltaproteobacteria bacterium]|nr:DUF1937 family protein [Deltaproteobacteria bacterium]
MIYLASPYAGEDEEKRFEDAQLACAILLKKGIKVFSPIVYGHPLAVKFGLPKDCSFWRGFNDFFLLSCEELWVLKLEGWQKSEGVMHEIHTANRAEIDIRYITLKECVEL